MAARQEAIAVVDLGFGDAGKGSLVDYLTRVHKVHTVIRFNGGAQAAHNVITPDQRHHTFAQFGSGSFVPGVRTYLSRFMLIEPYAMFNEEAHLRQLGVSDAFARTMLDCEALVITPFQSATNRLRELARSMDRHGSCGVGVGETVADSLRDPSQVIRAGELPDRVQIMRKLARLRDAKFSELQTIMPIIRDLPAAQDDLALFEAPHLIEIVADNYKYLTTLLTLTDDQALHALLNRPGVVIFEGAQGVLLDEWYGFTPYTTWSNTTFANVETLLHESAFTGKLTRLGILRAYFTRHGAGPFVTEDASLDAALPELHNVTDRWQQKFRVGYFDCVAARYALQVTSQLDGLAISHLDRLAALAQSHQEQRWQVCDSYRYEGMENSLDDFFSYNKANGQTITGIKVRRPPDLNHQAQLTQHLNHCRPNFQSMPHIETSYLAMLEQALGIPITITSHGPSAADKHMRPVNRGSTIE